MACSPNTAAAKLCEEIRSEKSARLVEHQVAGARVIDFGVKTFGSVRGGQTLARACMGGLADITLIPGDVSQYSVANMVSVQTDAPVVSCLGCQYAGWPVQSDDFFAMGSGPIRLLRGKEPLLLKLGLEDGDYERVCCILESDKLPSESAIQTIASESQCDANKLTIGIAPSTSIAGSIQVVARSVETAMHKLDELEFDVRDVVSATGCAPLPPPAKPGDTVGGIGRTNDAILYGATTSLWVDCEDEKIASVIDQVPSSSSKDHGRPFAKIFADYEYDFYKVDPGLFSPARIQIHNLRSGRTHSSGQIESNILRESFGT